MSSMPNQPDFEKVVIGVRGARVLDAKLRKLEAALGTDRATLIRDTLEDRVRDVKLTKAERAQIAADAEAARRKWHRLHG